MRSLLSDSAYRSELSQLGLLLLILFLGFGLRLSFATRVDLFVDEYTSILAMESVARRGLPILPSGLVYSPKGLLHSYIGGAVVWAFGSSDFLIRFISVLAGVITICYGYRVGRDWFSPTVGVMTAAALASLPTAVEWGARIRPYALLQMLCLIGGHLVINGYVLDHERRAGIVGLLALAISVFAHPLGLIMVGGLLAAIIVLRLVSLPDKKKVHPSTVSAAIAGILLVVAAIFLNWRQGAWGVHGTLESTIRRALSLSGLQEIIIYSLMFTHDFLTWPLWPLTLLYVLGLVTLVYRIVKRDLKSDGSIILTLYTVTLSVWLLTSALSSGLYHHRYLFQILPFYLLLAAREWQRQLDLILASSNLYWVRFQSILSAATVAAVSALLLPGALRMVQQTRSGWEAAYGYIRDQWRSGDALATCSPTPGYFILGKVDYYVTQHGEVSDDTDIWTGAPLVDTVEDFTTMILNEDRVWFVIDGEWCWKQNLSPRFRGAVHEKMSLAYKQHGTLVFLSNTD